MAERPWIGQSLPRLEDDALISGRARFVADLDVRDPLHVVLVRSQLPHARVTDVDVAAAARHPGVVGVVLAADLPLGATIRNDRLPSVRPTEVRALASGIVRSIGEPIAAVLAADVASVEDAAELVRVDYDPLEPVGTLEQAYAGDALVYPNWGDNVLARVTFSSGGVDDVFADAHVFRDRYLVPRFAPYGHATHVAIVEVDIESGSVTVMDYIVVHDCGRIVNPAIVEGQIVGGVAQGVGAALLEEVVYGTDGQLLTTGLMDYAIPTVVEIPPVRVAHYESPSPWVPGGFRGVGESGIIGAPAAIAGAVEDALVSAGARVRRLPLTPERVLSLTGGDTQLSGHMRSPKAQAKSWTASEGSPG